MLQNNEVILIICLDELETIFLHVWTVKFDSIILLYCLHRNADLLENVLKLDILFSVAHLAVTVICAHLIAATCQPSFIVTVLHVASLSANPPGFQFKPRVVMFLVLSEGIFPFLMNADKGLQRDRVA